MPTKGTKQQLKVVRISDGKKILNDIAALVTETLSAFHSDDKRDLKKIPSKITLVLHSIDVMKAILDDVLRYDGNLRLSQDLIQTDTAKRNTEIVIKNRLQKSSPTNKRKSQHQVSLEIDKRSGAVSVP